MWVMEKDLAGTILHLCRDAAGTGLVSGEAANFTYVLTDESRNTQTTGVTITEQSTSGRYDLAFTPDAVGNWHLAITNPAGTDESVTDYFVQVVLNAAGLTPSGNYLTTLANLKEQVDIRGSNPANAPDSYLNNLIARATHRCERAVGRALVQANYTEYVSGDGSRYLNLRRGPIQSVTSVSYITYDSAGNETATVETAGNYFVWGDQSDWKKPGYLEYNGSSWVRGQRNYKVVYSAGFATVPYDLEQACLHACVSLKNKRKDVASLGRSIGDGSMSVKDEIELDEELRRMLIGYIDSRVA
jgi:hypothetical protein